MCVFIFSAEKGEFLALDLGGSRFKVLQVKVSENGKRKVQMESETYPIPEEVLNGRGTEVRSPHTFMAQLSHSNVFTINIEDV